MNKINTKNQVNNKSNNWKNLGYTLMITTLLNISNPIEAKINNKTDNHRQLTEVLDTSNIINNVEKKTGVKIPNEYTEKLNNFVATNEVMKSRNGVKFTEDFIVNEMQNNWGINKENQLLFIRSAVYKQITNKDLYDGSDGNDERLGEFMKVVSNVKKCGKDYVNGFNTYMQQRSAEADRRSAQYKQESADADRRSAQYKQESADADRRSAEADRRSAEALTSSLDNLIRFYNRYKKDPSTIKDDEVTRRKKDGKKVIQRCKEEKIDYKAKLSPEMLKFYGVE